MIVGGLPRAEFDVTLDDGRRVTLDRVVLTYTYSGVLEGDPSRVEPARWYTDAANDALHHFHLHGRASQGKGVVVVEPRLRETPPFPAKPHVPWVQVLVFASSWHDGAGSALALAWFQDSFDEPLLARFSEALASIPSWTAVAIPWCD